MIVSNSCIIHVWFFFQLIVEDLHDRILEFTRKMVEATTPYLFVSSQFAQKICRFLSSLHQNYPNGIINDDHQNLKFSSELWMIRDDPNFWTNPSRDPWQSVAIRGNPWQSVARQVSCSRPLGVDPWGPRGLKRVPGRAREDLKGAAAHFVRWREWRRIYT